VIGLGGPSQGRGAWICRVAGGDARAQQSCVDAALRSGGFARAWRTQVSAELEAHIRSATDEGMTTGKG
jgi:predicted RNA-binding protein YlxR (DUF448 family)